MNSRIVFIELSRAEHTTQTLAYIQRRFSSGELKGKFYYYVSNKNIHHLLDNLPGLDENLSNDDFMVFNL